MINLNKKKFSLILRVIALILIGKVLSQSTVGDILRDDPAWDQQNIIVSSVLETGGKSLSLGDFYLSLESRLDTEGDSAFTMVTEDMPRPYGPVADKLEQRAEWTKEFMEKAFSRPDFVGWHYCGLIDATYKNPRKKGRQHSGLIDQFGNPYPILQKYIKQFTGEMYKIASDR